MRFDLFKIMDKRYVDDFRNGFLYMNNVRYFHDNFRDPIVGDFMEGEFIARGKEALSGFDPEFRKHIAPTVLFEDENYASTHIFCMYSIQVNHSKRWVLHPDGQLLKFCNSEAKDAEMVAVRITNTKQFTRQISAHLRRLINAHDCDYAEMGHIKYVDNFVLNGCHTRKDGYAKRKDYNYQQEWRIHVSFTPKPCGPTRLYVGDLHRLTEVISLDDIVNGVDKLYPGCTVIDASMEPLAYHQSFGNPQLIRSCKIPGRMMINFTSETFE